MGVNAIGRGIVLAMAVGLVAACTSRAPAPAAPAANGEPGPPPPSPVTPVQSQPLDAPGA